MSIQLPWWLILQNSASPELCSSKTLLFHDSAFPKFCFSRSLLLQISGFPDLCSSRFLIFQISASPDFWFSRSMLFQISASWFLLLEWEFFQENTESSGAKPEKGNNYSSKTPCAVWGWCKPGEQECWDSPHVPLPQSKGYPCPFEQWEGSAVQ